MIIIDKWFNFPKQWLILDFDLLWSRNYHLKVESELTFFLRKNHVFFKPLLLENNNLHKNEKLYTYCWNAIIHNKSNLKDILIIQNLLHLLKSSIFANVTSKKSIFVAKMAMKSSFFHQFWICFSLVISSNIILKHPRKIIIIAK